MLAKDKKIDSLLFEDVFKKGKNIGFKYFYVVYLNNKNNEKSRIACVTSKKQFKKAVDRNKAKRLCFNIIKDFYNQIPSSLNIVIFLKKEFLEIEKETLKKELLKIIQL